MRILRASRCPFALFVVLLAACGRAPVPPSPPATTAPAVAAAPVVPAAPAVAPDSTPAAASYESWDDLSDLESTMKSTKRAFRTLQRAGRGNDAEEVRSAARDVEARLSDLSSRAASFRGETPDKFREYTFASLAAARAVARAAEGNEAGSLAPAIQDLDRSCKTCHEVYREEE